MSRPDFLRKLSDPDLLKRRLRMFAMHDAIVARNLQLHQRGPLQTLQPRPQRDRPRARLTGRDTLLERDIAREPQLARSGEDIGGMALDIGARVGATDNPPPN